MDTNTIDFANATIRITDIDTNEAHITEGGWINMDITLPDGSVIGAGYWYGADGKMARYNVGEIVVKKVGKGATAEALLAAYDENREDAEWAEIAKEALCAELTKQIGEKLEGRSWEALYKVWRAAQ